jgi:hypothetical protein
MAEKDKKDPNMIHKKLAAKIIMAPIKIGRPLLDEQGKKEMDLFQIAGIATDTKVGVSNFGEWVALLGDFQATNVYTGEIMRAAKVLLPPILLELVQGKMAGQGSDGRGVTFAFMVGIKVDEDPRSSLGYTYYAKNIVAPSADDPMTKLLASVPSVKVQKLAEPKK